MRYGKRCHKILAIVLILFLCVALVSCGSDAGGVQQPTDQLTICLGQHNEVAFDLALSLFKEKFPDVNVEVRDFGFSNNEIYIGAVDSPEDMVLKMEEFGVILGAEMMAGSGPDLLIWGQDWAGNMEFFNDLAKTVNTGVFADINPYIETDSEFDAGDFVSGVFDGGVFGGKRYFVPLGYSVPGVETTRRTLELWGIDMPEKPTWEEFAAAYNQAYEQAKDDENKWIERYCDVQSFIRNSGIKFLDYENQKSVVDYQQLKTFYDDIRPGAALMAERAESNEEASISVGIAGLGSNLFLERPSFGSVLSDLLYGGLLSETGDVIHFAEPQVDGGKPPVDLYVCAAICGGSDNQYNAYEFIKQLLSDDVQSTFELFGFGAPVRTDSIRGQIDNLLLSQAGRRDVEELYPSEQEIEDYMSILSDVEYNYVAPQVVRMVEEAMAPYVEGTSSYEECFEELEKELNFYVSE